MREQKPLIKKKKRSKRIITREEKLIMLLQDENEFKTLFVEDADQTLVNLAARGVEMNKEELGELCAGMLDGMGHNEDELFEEAMETVAGGFSPLKVLDACLRDVVKAVSGGAMKGRSDKKNKSLKGMSYVEGANTIVGKGARAIGYTIGWYLS